MSIEGFVLKCERRLSELYQRVQEIKKADGGKKVYRHMQKELAEIHVLTQAIYKANRKGLKE